MTLDGVIGVSVFLSLLFYLIPLHLFRVSPLVRTLLGWMIVSWVSPACVSAQVCPCVHGSLNTNKKAAKAWAQGKYVYDKT